MTHQTGEQVRAAKLAAMGHPLGEVHHLLWHDVAWLHMRWREYRDLFGTDRETIDLLNDTARAFFYSLQGTLWEAVLMHICRLTDAPQWHGHERLTLRRLSDADLIPDEGLRSKVDSLVEDAETKSAFARDWRNRRLAHRELPPLDGGSPQPLAGASRQHVEEALRCIRNAVNCVEVHYMGASVRYEHMITSLHGVESLLRHLKRARRAARQAEFAL